MTDSTSVVESLFHGDPLRISLCLVAIFLACPAVLMKVVPKVPVLRKVTFVPFLFLAPMVLSSLGIIPGSYSLYKPLQSFALYMAIFFMVLAIDVGRILRSLDPRVLLLFLLGCLGTGLGAAVAHVVCSPLIGEEPSAMVAACTAAAYSGGSMNWAAVSEAIEVPDSLNATAFPAMVIMYTLYLGALLALENSPLRPALERWIGAARPAAAPVAPVADPGGAESAGPPRLEDYIHGFLAFSVVYLASILLEQLVGGLVFVPQVIFLTTFAILLGAAAPHTKLAVARRLVRMSAFGEASLYFLLGIIGAQATLTESLMHAPVLLLVPTVVIAVHVLVLLPGARLLRVDLVTGAIVSIAAIGGAASAPAAAGALKAAELIPLGVLLGSLGYALGTYLGVYVGVLLLP
ncbi:MAG: DUF819 family protein [Rhodopirellula sp.]|nr:DUF819 family protein [Rhodopirellula sp.]